MDEKQEKETTPQVDEKHCSRPCKLTEIFFKDMFVQVTSMFC